jgi:succinyl-CoA synthetase beta subunit
MMQALYRAFDDCDCSIAEINPLILTKEGAVMALDAKINFDANALYRHKDILALRDLTEEDPREVEASRHDLSYISLNGNIACMVNGAGLAMATMDIIKQCGGEPANFLDVGGGANQEKVAHAFRILLADERVRGVFINIFGGIMRCDVLAQGVVDAARDSKMSLPLVVRMQGTNVEQGKKILTDSGLPIISAETMAEAAEKIVAAVKQF